VEKIKDTKLGGWLKTKAPGILSLVGDLLPDKGGLGIVKNLLDKEKGVDPGEAKAAVQAEVEFQNNVSRRWEADMSSDVKIAKVIRPATMIVLMLFFMIMMVWDGLDESFMPKESYVSLLEILMLTVFGAYFAGRTIEKTKR
tara:strand:- start:562 stop:987 length:426 start_codon:yes stop_codon:yes gene_type:complete